MIVRRLLISLLLAFAAVASFATVAPDPLFTNNLVLQRNNPVPVFGTAAPGENVTVTFAGQSVSGTADSQGDWRVNLAPMPANATAATMTIAGTNTVTVTGVMVGDVWLCSGQSNMTMPVSYANRPADISSANFPGIRVFSVGQVNSNQPTKDMTGSWTVCSPSTAGGLPGVAFYFARKIYQDQSAAIPIGILQSARGSTNIDVWVAPEAIATIPALTPILAPSTANWPPFCFFNGMIYPQEPYAFYGVIWYQGESREGTSQSVDSYYLKEKAVIQGWRHLWGGEELPFYVVQLPAYEAAAVGPTPDTKTTSRADTRVQQANVLGLPQTGMAVGIDVGDADNIHPTDKLDIGERLALWALKHDYGRTSIVESGPILRDVTLSGSSLVCTFDYVGSGLMVGSKVPCEPTQEVIGGTLARFSIAGSNGVWYDATAVISGDTVVVSSPSVPTPNKVAYAHWPNPTGCNLYNRDGLPASPFYVDDINSRFTVTAAAGAGGSITPAGGTSYLKRKTALYTITPDAGYYIQDVKVDNVSVGSVRHYTFDPLYANHTISATFVEIAPSYTITASAGAGGSLSTSGVITADQGSSQRFKVVPNAGVWVDTVTVDNIPVGNRTSYTFADVRANHTISATFKCKITAVVGYGGAITPAGTTDVSYGGSKTFTIAPYPGFTTTSVKVDGVEQGIITSYTFTGVTGPHTISATFTGGGGTQDGVPNIYDLLFSVDTDSLPASGNTGKWATYIPSGKTLATIGVPTVETVGTVKWEKNVASEYDGFNYGTYANPIICNGASFVMAIRPVLDSTNSSQGYLVGIFNDRLTLGVRVNDGKVFVKRNGTTVISSTALPDGQPAVLSLVAQPNGSYKVWANGVQIMNDTSTSDITALTPYGNNNSVTLGASATTGAYTYNGNIGDTFVYLIALSDADRQQLEAALTAKFSGTPAVTHTITATAGAGGSISPAGAVSVYDGASKTFTIAPSGGYAIADVKVDNVSVGAVASYTFTNVVADHTISATFTTSPSVVITATAGTGGTITPSGSVQVTIGANQSFAIAPSTGYAVSDVLVDGVSVGPVTTYTFNDVTTAHSIAASFSALPPLTITASAEPGGTITPSGSVSVSSGGSQTFTIAASPGYAIDDVEVDDTSVGPVSSYTFSSVTANHIIFARFKAVTGGVPRQDQLYGSWVSESLPASGSIGTWASYMPAGLTFTKMGSPTVDNINGMKWANMHQSSGDGFDLGLFSSTYSIPCTGASVVMIVRPVRNALHTDWVTCFSVFTYTLSFGIRNDTGNLCARRNSTLFDFPTAVIPDGQVTVLSLVVQPNGTFKIWANGTLMVNSTATASFTEMAPTWSASDGGRHITMARAYSATWSCFNGDIGDTYFYKTALTDAERQQLESLISAKFIPADVASIAAIRSQVGQKVKLTGSAVVTYAPRKADGSRSTNYFYLGEAQGMGCMRVVDTSADDLIAGMSVTGLSGTVSRSEVTGEYFLTLFSDPVGNGSTPVPPLAAVEPLGMTNGSAVTDAKALTNLVKIWGKVTAAATGSFTLSDGSPANVDVTTNSVPLPVGFGVGSLVSVTGIVTKDSTGKVVLLAQSVEPQ